MKSMIKVSLFFAVSFIFQLAYASDNESDFYPYTTEKYIYNKTITKILDNSLQTTVFGRYTPEKNNSDITTYHSFDNGITRIKITVETHQDYVLLIKEIWTSRYVSQMTAGNIALTGSIISAIAISGLWYNAIVALRAKDHPNHDYWANFMLHNFNTVYDTYDQKPFRM